MSWFNKLDEIQSEMYGKLLDYLQKNGNTDFARYDKDNDLIEFKIGDKWYCEYDVNIWDVADIADILEIKCTYNN